MLYIDAVDTAGNQLELASNRNIEISIPTTENVREGGFSIFSARVEAGAPLNWIERTPAKAVSSEKQLYVWQKMSKEEREEVRARKKEIVARWKKYGKQNRAASLRRYKVIASKRHKRNSKRKRFRSYSTRDYEKVSNMMVLGNSTHRWHKDTTSEVAMTYYYRFTASTLGVWNIDRLLKTSSKSRMIVNSEEGQDIRLVSSGRFILLFGKFKEDKTVFKGVPDDMQVMLTSVKRLPDNMVEFGYLKTVTAGGVFKIDNHQVYTEEAFKAELTSLAGASEN